jgi:hypothetical protein
MAGIAYPYWAEHHGRCLERVVDMQVVGAVQFAVHRGAGSPQGEFQRFGAVAIDGFDNLLTPILCWVDPCVYAPGPVPQGVRHVHSLRACTRGLLRVDGAVIGA